MSIERAAGSKANKDFVSTILKSGTVTDKVSALTLLIQESPVHTLTHLSHHLINGMAKKKSRREAILAIDSVKDLMISNLLPDRKLKYFIDQPLLSKKVRPMHLIVWYFEDCLKKAYYEFVKTLEVLYISLKLTWYCRNYLKILCLMSNLNLLLVFLNSFVQNQSKKLIY